MRRSLTAVVLLAAFGCGPVARGNGDTTSSSDSGTGAAGDTTGKAQVADSGVTLSLDKNAYDPGTNATMTFTSQRADTLGYNPCSDRTVERETSGGWVLHPEPNRMCTMELRLLLPGATASAQTDIPGDVTAGTYRIVLRFRPERSDTTPASPVSAVSAPFRVPAS